MRPPSPSRPLRAPDQRARSERGVVFPSPVVVLSVVAVAMAAFAFVATRGQEPTEREVTPAAATPSPTSTPTPSMPTAKPKNAKPPIDKGKVYVEVYNNSGVTGLAGRVAATATQAGWKVVGSDNWYGTIPASTVYYPPRLGASRPRAGPRPRHPPFGPGRRPDEARPAHRHPHLRPLLTAFAPPAWFVPGWRRGVHLAGG